MFFAPRETRTAHVSPPETGGQRPCFTVMAAYIGGRILPTAALSVLVLLCISSSNAFVPKTRLQHQPSRSVPAPFLVDRNRITTLTIVGYHAHIYATAYWTLLSRQQQFWCFGLPTMTSRMNASNISLQYAWKFQLLLLYYKQDTGRCSLRAPLGVGSRVRAESRKQRATNTTIRPARCAWKNGE